jgi:hypothetical protein
MPETSRQPVRQEWPGFLTAIAEVDRGHPVSIEVISAELGSQVEAEGMPLEDLAYDERADAFVISVGSQSGEPGALRHVVEQPWKILFDPPSPLAVRTIDVEGPDGAHTLVTLHSRPSLPTD